MPGWKTWAALEEVTATNMNSYVRDQVIAIYTNAAARTAAGGGTPTRGSQSFLTDLFEHQVYYGATTGWRKPWSLPWGTVGYFENSTVGTQNLTGTAATITSLTGSVDQVLNRVYRATWKVNVTTSAGSSVGLYQVRRGGTVVGTGYELVSGGTSIQSWTGTTRFTGASTATVTIDLAGTNLSGTQTSNVTTTTRSFLLIEDIGPSSSTPPAS